MVLIEGEGTVGMRGQPYGIVPTEHLERVEAPESGCAEAVARTAGATACWVQTDLVDPVLRPRPVRIDDFCIEALPFPGAGGSYTADGMTAWGAHQLHALLSTGRYGTRRLCTATEFQVATAGPKTNHRFVYGDERVEGRCPSSLPIGADPDCVNRSTGVHEYGAIHSHWTLADGDFVGGACDAPPCHAAGNRLLASGMYVVMGGTSRAQTRQAPLTPHTWHDHGDPAPAPCDDRGWDDQPVICATPDAAYNAPVPSVEVAAQGANWDQLLAVARSTGSMSQTLSEGLGRSICK